jgi:hypothetical protein
VTQSFYSHGRKTKDTQNEDTLDLGEVEEQVALLLFKYPTDSERIARRKKRFSHGRTADASEEASDQTEIARLLQTYAKKEVVESSEL